MASGVDARLLKSTKFPPEFNKKVDMQKVNLAVIKKWVANRISDILGNEDDVVIELCFNLIEGSRFPDVKSLQIQLTGFLEKETAPFTKELWNLLLSAQGSPQGVPKELLEAKKLELIQEKIEADRAAEETRRRREDEDRRDREISHLKERDRRDRGGDRGRGPMRGGRRGDRAFDGGRGGGRNPNRSRSPEGRFRGSRDPYGRDSYYPRGRSDRGRDRGRGRARSRTRSESASSRSRSSYSSRSESIDRPRHPRKRSRSRSGHRQPRQKHRGGDGDRDRYGRTRRSRSPSSDSGSPAAKRSRHSPPSSRSRSGGRRDRSSSRSSSGRRSDSYSRRARRSSKGKGRNRRSYSSDGGKKTGHDRANKRDSPPDSRVQNSSSVTPPLSRRKSADISEDIQPAETKTNE